MNWDEVLQILGWLVGAWSLGFTGGWLLRILKRGAESTH
jgi:hypothetical protein